MSTITVHEHVLFLKRTRGAKLTNRIKKGANGNDCKGVVISAEFDDVGVGVGVVQVQVTVAVFPLFPA